MGASRWTAAVVAALALAAPARGARAEATRIRVSKGYGVLYLPLMVMESQKLLEKHARAAGLGEVEVTWPTFDGGNIINDAMLSGALDVAAIGAPGFITLWAKAKGLPKLEVSGIAGLSATSLYLNTRNPRVKSLRDFGPGDKIALPGIKTSLSAVVLQMAVAQEFGIAEYARLDPLTVGLPHPEAFAALTSGKTDVNSHFGSPPFSYLELESPGVHRVMSSVDFLGNITMDVVYCTRRFHDENPRTIAAFLAALDEANAFIARDPRGAAEIYARASKVKVSPDEVLRMLRDPDTRFSTTPTGVMRYATFMHQAGTIKVKAASWKELFFPEVHHLPGS
ncbi:MAG TPA: ABC transporter substrate-binding protein [Anaeromyxobacter sp.]|nr:ABC transporter substrate-binding protein [Anaeromyxobacter sp.]